MYIYIYICMYVCIFTYVYIHIYTSQYILTTYVLTIVNLLNLNNILLIFFVDLGRKITVLFSTSTRDQITV